MSEKNGAHLDLDEAKKKLLELKAELCKKTSRPVRAIPMMPDQLDTVTANGDRAVEVTERNMAYKQLQLVNAALTRIQNGNYTQCEGDDCDEQIHVKRLLAIRYARYCTKCQALIDGTTYVNNEGAREPSSQIFTS